MSRSEILVLGKIQGARGVHGNLRVYRRGEMLGLLKRNSSINLYKASGIKDGFLLDPAFVKTQILSEVNSLTPDTLEIKLTGLDNAEDAWNYKGLFVGMDLSEARKKFHNPDDPYLFEYLDLNIYEAEELKGKVDRIEEYQNKQWLVCVCTNSAAEEVLIPLQGPFIENVDFSAQKIMILPNSGLFSTDEPG